MAVSAAKAAFHRNSKWRLLDASERCRLLNKFADLILRDAQYLAELESYDNGMNINQAYEYVYSRAKYMRYYASLADKIQGDTIPAGKSNHLTLIYFLPVSNGNYFTDGDVFTYTLKQPMGVCGLILPWNSPISNFVTKVTIALAAGKVNNFVFEIKELPTAPPSFCACVSPALRSSYKLRTIM